MKHLDVIAKMEELVTAKEGVIETLRNEISKSENPIWVLSDIKRRIKAVREFEGGDSKIRLKSGFHRNWSVATDRILLGHYTLEEAQRFYLDNL